MMSMKFDIGIVLSLDDESADMGVQEGMEGLSLNQPKVDRHGGVMEVALKQP